MLKILGAKLQNLVAWSIRNPRFVQSCSVVSLSHSHALQFSKFWQNDFIKMILVVVRQSDTNIVLCKLSSDTLYCASYQVIKFKSLHHGNWLLPCHMGTDTIMHIYSVPFMSSVLDLYVYRKGQRNLQENHADRPIVQPASSPMWNLPTWYTECSQFVL
jgi:hypothetical protein